VREAAAVAIHAVRDADSKVEEVRFVLFGREAYRAFDEALETG
jgi:O-acetyl-ADP-ribose deacetylase (regulator of RNase III)